MQFLDPIISDGASIRWHRLDLSLRCEHGESAEAPPVRILEGCIMGMMPRELKPVNKPRLFFHVPVGNIGDRIKVGRIYKERVVFPSADPNVPAKFLANLGAPIPNFHLAPPGRPRLMSLADLQRETPQPLGTDEICLDFHTLLDLKLSHGNQFWRIDVVEFGRRVGERLAKAFGLQLPAPETLWAGFHLLPYFWERSGFIAPSSTSKGSRTPIGNVGPLYLRGPLARVWPLLLLAREVGLGSRYPGTGAYTLDPDRRIFADRIRTGTIYREAFEEMFTQHDHAGESHACRGDPGAAASELSTQISAGSWRPSAARGFHVPNNSGERKRLVVQLAADDFVVHKALLRLLRPYFARMFEPVSADYRSGVSLAVVRGRIRMASPAGRIWAVRVRIKDLFDQMDWTVLMETLVGMIPRGDALVLALLAACIQTPVNLNGMPMPRQRGVLQGSPLSPLLADIYLKDFDEEMEQRGLCMVRFTDEIFVLCQSDEEAKAALSIIAALLEPFKLRLSETAPGSIASY